MVHCRQSLWIGIVFFVVLGIFVQSTFAATSIFDINTLVGSDTQPPTVPTGLTAIGVATTQIDLSWATSTDNGILSGYHVWRDGFLIATTTVTSYADTGLFAATSYTYYVTAFDSLFNESASSSEVTATTLSSSTPTATSSSASGATYGSRGRVFRDQIISVEIFPQQDSVVIHFETAGYIRSVIKWGETTSYELGSIAERAFSKIHETKIVGLTPGTRYRFTLEGEDKFGRYGTMHSGTFVTLPPDDIFPPQNVSNLRAVREGDDIILSWSNPTDSDFTKVRVVRSDRFYPNDIADGWVVYEGDGETVRDTQGAIGAPKQFYTVFAYDALGNISSGAVVAIRLTGVDENLFDPTKNDIGLLFEHINFIQEGIPRLVEGDSVLIDGTKQVTISIPYERFPEHLKTILVTLHHPQDSTLTFDFILRINKNKTAYEGVFAPLGISGLFKIQVSIFDFLTSQIGYTDGSLISHIGGHDDLFGVSSTLDSSQTKKIFIVLLILVIVILSARFSMRMFVQDRR